MFYSVIYGKTKITFINTTLENDQMITKEGWGALHCPPEEVDGLLEHGTKLKNGTLVDVSQRRGHIIPYIDFNEFNITSYLYNWTPHYFNFGKDLDEQEVEDKEDEDKEDEDKEDEDKKDEDKKDDDDNKNIILICSIIGGILLIIIFIIIIFCVKRNKSESIEKIFEKPEVNKLMDD